MRPGGRIRFMAAVLVLGACTPAIAGAQAWQVEFHGAVAPGRSPGGGTHQTPPAGPTFTMADGIQTTRAVSSWFFGDGADLFNRVMLLRGAIARLPALEQPGWPPVGRTAGLRLGARVTRATGMRFAVEAAVDVVPRAFAFTGAGRQQIEGARAGFVTAFTALNNSTPALLPNPQIAATAEFGASGTELVTTGALVYRGERTARTQPYVLAGAGLTSPVGRGPSVTLTGTYLLTNPSQVSFQETDRATLQYRADRAFVWVFGGGAVRSLSSRTAFRVDGRLLVTGNAVRMRVSAQPSSAAGSPSGAAILNSTNPGIQFSTLSGMRTTLSGSPIADFEAFRGSGRHLQVVLSVSYVRTF